MAKEARAFKKGIHPSRHKRTIPVNAPVTGILAQNMAGIVTSESSPKKIRRIGRVKTEALTVVNKTEQALLFQVKGRKKRAA